MNDPTDSLTMTNPNIRRFYDMSFIGKIVLDSTHENVLTNIRVVEDQRGNGYSRGMLYKWLNWCASEGYDAAYVVNIKSERLESVLRRLRKYDTQKVSIQKAPGNIESGPGIPDLTYEIVLK